MAEQLEGRGRGYGIVIGLVLLAVTLIVPPPEGLSPQAWRVAGVALLMAAWWITEALPIPATALLPLVLFPLFGIASARDAAAPYADPVIFLFLGGFIIGAAMQRWQLHRRIGLTAISRIGTAPHRLIGGFMLASALLSMWVSNSATAIMMLPVALSVLALIDRHGEIDPDARASLSVVLMLAVAYGANIGGLGTLIGTPPNALLAAYMAREHGVQIGFAQWMALGVPLVVILLLGTWLILMRLHRTALAAAFDAGDVVAQELNKLGALTAAELRVAIVFAATALAWVTRPLLSPYVPGLDDTTIAIAGALALFLIPSGMPEGGRLIGWDDLSALPWGVLVLFGGGLSLASAIAGSGLAEWLGNALSALGHWPLLLLVAVATVAMIFLTELTSNTASAAAFLPFGGAVALGIGIDPLLLTVPLALAASCAFMLPVATPPNAIVFASGRIAIAQMARAGLWLNLYASIVIIALSYPLVTWLFRV
jgi:solute carrier family 13 (sodium-dependent dicarboxylate transporter), member 2/3/5